MKTFQLNTGFWIEKEHIESIAIFNKMFIKTGNIAKPEKINDLNQLYVRFPITTETALEWLYKWIHENLLDGSVNHYRDQEIQYITGSNEFINTVYKIIYNKQFQPNNPVIQHIDNIKK